jgi:hypothetical protein
LSARDLYVNNLAGDDRNTGTSAQSLSPGNGPVRTIQRALEIAVFGDRIVLAATGEAYRECVTFEGPDNSGTSLTPFILDGNGAVLDGTRPIPPLAWRPARKDVIAFRPYRLSYQRLFFDGAPTAPQAIDDRGQLDPGHWAMLNQAFHFRPERGATIDDYDLSCYFHPVGITLYDVRDVIVRNLTIQGYRLDGVNAHDNAFDCQLDSLTCRENGRSGISVGGASRVKIVSSRLEGNGQTQLRIEGWSRVSVEQSEIVGEPRWMIEGGKLTVDGEPQRRGVPMLTHDRAPLHRP